MSARLLLPARSLLKPDRTIVAPGDPGWDDAPPDRPRARRSGWWRSLLAGRAGLTRLQPGACCGCATPCLICPLPAANLTLTTSVTSGTDTRALVYTAGAVQTWAACVPLSLGGGSGSHRVVLGCKPGVCTFIDIANWTGANCTGTSNPLYHDNSDSGCTACNGIDPFCPANGINLTLQPSSTCSPLNLIWKTLVGYTWTITP